MVQVPPAPSPQLPFTPPTNYAIPSANSEALSSIYDMGQRMATTSITQTAQKDAAEQQTAAGTTKDVATDDTDFSSLYSQQFNKSANLIYTSQKKNALDLGLKSIYQNSPNDPVAFNAAAEAYKGTFMSDVPALIQAPMLDEFNNRQTAYAGDVLGNQTTVVRGQALASSNARIQQVKTDAYQKILQGGDVSAPDVASGLSEIDTLLSVQTDPNQLGGPLITPQQALEARTGLAEEVKDAEVTHQFNQQPYAAKAGFLAHLTTTGIDGMRPDKQQVLMNRLKQDFHADEAEHRQVVNELRSDVSEARSYAYMGLPLPDDIANLQQRVRASGDPSLIRGLNNAITVGSATRAFALQPLDAMGKEIDADTAKLEAGAGTQADAMALRVKQSLFQSAQTELASDPLKFAAKHRIIESAAMAPVDLTSDQSIQTRMDAVRKTEATFGVPVSPLSPSESRDLAKSWPTMAPDQQIAHLDAYAKFNMTPAEQASLYAVLGKDNPSIPVIAGMLKDPTQRATAAAALDGMNFVRNNPETVDKDGLVKRAIAGQLSQVLGADPGGQNLKSLVPMVTGLYAKDAEKTGSFEVLHDDATLNGQNAVAKFFGYKAASELPQINNRSFMPFERGITTDAATTVWRSTTDDDLKAMNGGALPTDNMGSQSHPIDAAALRKSFPVYSGVPGQYWVGTSDKTGNVFRVTGQDGQPFVWNYGTQKAASVGRVVPFVAPPNPGPL